MNKKNKPTGIDAGSIPVGLIKTEEICVDFRFFCFLRLCYCSIYDNIYRTWVHTPGRKFI